MTSILNNQPKLDVNFLDENAPENIPTSFKDKFEKIKNNVELKKTENIEDSIKRQSSQYGARALEIFAGLPGNLKKAAQQSTDYFKSFAPEMDSFGKWEKEHVGEREKGSFMDFIFNPPSSGELREEYTKPISEKFLGDKEYLEPKNELEKGIGEFTQDLTSFFMPGTNQLRTVVRLGAPIVGNLTKQGMKYLGAEEETAEKAKLGVMLMATMAGQSNPGQFAGQRIGEAKQMIPQNATVNAAPLAQSLLPLYNRLNRGLNVPSKSRAMQGMGDLAGQVQQGRLNFHSLMDARDNINEWIAEAGGWDIPGAVRDQTLRNLNQLKTSIIETIDNDMATRFPQAGELYRSGYQAAAVNHRSNAISNFIERNFGKKVASAGAKILFPSLVGGAAVLPKTAAFAGATYPLYKAGQIMYRTANSPTLAAYYTNIIRDASLGNVPAMIKNLEKFDKAMLKEEKKDEKNKQPNIEDFKAKFKKKD